MKKVILPELGEGIEEAVISGWLISEGQGVKKGEDLAELTTDKAVFNVPSPDEGTLKKIIRREGDTVKPGEILAELE